MPGISLGRLGKFQGLPYRFVTSGEGVDSFPSTPRLVTGNPEVVQIDRRAFDARNN